MQKDFLTRFQVGEDFRTKEGGASEAEWVVRWGEMDCLLLFLEGESREEGS